MYYHFYQLMEIWFPIVANSVFHYKQMFCNICILSSYVVEYMAERIDFISSY